MSEQLMLTAKLMAKQVRVVLATFTAVLLVIWVLSTLGWYLCLLAGKCFFWVFNTLNQPPNGIIPFVGLTLIMAIGLLLALLGSWFIHNNEEAETILHRRRFR